MGVVHRFVGTDTSPKWEGVTPQAYTESGTEGAVRHVLVGPEDGAGNFVLRHFRIPVGGASALDRHAHDHGVYILRGSARVTLNEERHEIGPGDAIHIAPHDQHQLVNTGDGPLEFICVIPPTEPGNHST